MDAPLSKLDNLPLDCLKLIWNATCESIPIFMVSKKWARNYPSRKIRISGISTIQLYKWARTNGYQPGPKTARSIALGGNLKVLQYATNAGGVKMDTELVANAASRGQYHIIEWLLTNPKGSPVWNTLTPCMRAALVGDLDMIKWLLKKKKSGFRLSTYVWGAAAKHGHIHILKWAKADKVEKLSAGVTESAADGGQLATIQWLYKTEGRDAWSTDVCDRLAERGNLDTLKWVVEHGCPYDDYACEAAASNGRLDVLKWLRCDDEDSFEESQGEAEDDDIDFIHPPRMFVDGRRIRCRWDTSTAQEAAEHGHLEVLQWALEHEAPYTPHLLVEAAGKGHKDVVKYLCEFDPDLLLPEACSRAAGKGGYLDVLKILRAHRCPWSYRTICNAAENGHLDILKWALIDDEEHRRERGDPCPWSDIAYAHAVHRNHTLVVAWMKEQGLVSAEAIKEVGEYDGETQVTDNMEELHGEANDVEEEVEDENDEVENENDEDDEV